MPDERFREHLEHPAGRGETPAGALIGAAGGAACGDLVTVRIRVDGDRVGAAGFDAEGCGSMIAAASAAVSLAEGAHVLDAARIGSREVAAALGGLSVGKLHAADLAADALARALGAAVSAQAALAPEPRRTLVAMSGGVDSAVAALLCERAGGEVCAVTLELWADPDNDGERSCCSASAVRSARSLAHGLGLPHLTVDLRAAFRAGVVEPWLAGHAEGRTPNPCVRCNGNVRLDAMLDLATRLGAATLATGHYARVTDDGLVRAAADPAKDQSYMLARLDRASIARLRFPLGGLVKTEVRGIARDHGLPVADQRDSQDLCFLAGTGRAAFLAKHGGLRERPGEILDESGRALGRHRGHHGFTVGQRRGLGVQRAEPLYVLRTDARANTVTVGPRAALGTTCVELEEIVLHRPAGEVDGVRLRSHAAVVPARLDGASVRLEREFAGAAPGQQAALLRGDAIAGYATIA